MKRELFIRVALPITMGLLLAAANALFNAQAADKQMEQDRTQLFDQDKDQMRDRDKLLEPDMDQDRMRLQDRLDVPDQDRDQTRDQTRDQIHK